VLVNGETGQVAGDKPLSWIKVLAVVTAMIVALGLLGVGLLRALSALTLPPELMAFVQQILNVLQPVSFLLLPAIVMLVIIAVIVFHD
jgi:hypothetical protein